VPKDVFNTIHDTEEIVGMASNIGNYYDKLHVINCRKEMGNKIDERDHIKAIWLALHASYALEAFRFMVSFATSLAMVENKIFIGNGNIISLILQDELLHKGWTAYLINQVVKEDPRFVVAARECEQEVIELYKGVIQEEKAWADYLFQKGPVIGLNANILKDFVDYTDKKISFNKEIILNTKVKWTPEIAQDLHGYGIDAESELISLMSQEIAREIDAQILRDMGSEIRTTEDFLSVINNIESLLIFLSRLFL
jgi:hypothetical protein